MPNRSLKNFGVVDIYGDILLNIFSLIVSFLFVPTLISYVPTELYTKPYIYLLMFFLCLFASLVYQIFNVYAESSYLRFRDSVLLYIGANMLILLIVVYISRLLFRESWTFWRILLGLNFLFSTALLITKREITISILHYFRMHRYQLRKTVIIGDNTETAKLFIGQINKHPEYGCMILGYVGDCIRSDVGCDKLGSFENLGEILDRYHPDEAVFAIDSYNKKRLLRLVNQCDDRAIKVYFLPVLYGFFKSPKQISRVGDLPVINIHATPMDNRGTAVLKRIFDVLGALFLLVLTSPFTLVVSLWIRFTLGKSVFVKQDRIGRFGHCFSMFVFNTVDASAEKDGENTVSTAAFKLSAFLRRFSLCELPSLFNVLVGEMSLVGPYPELPAHADFLRSQSPSYILKRDCKPGMTGLSQLCGLRGDDALVARLETDIEYIETWSLPKDFWIALMTPIRMVFPPRKEEEASNVAENPSEKEENCEV